MKFPIHPITVHFPIAFYFLELILLFIWFSKRDPQYLKFASFVFKIAYVSMLIAIAAGFYDAGGFAGIEGGVRVHFFAAVSVFIVSTLRALFWRFGKPEQNHYRASQMLFALAGNILVAITGYFGGLLVYGS